MKAIVKGDWFYDYENDSNLVKKNDKVIKQLKEETK